MEQTALVLIVMTNVLLVLILAAIGFFMFRLLKQQKNQNASFLNPPSPPPSQESSHLSVSQLPAGLHPGILERVRPLEKVKLKRTDLFCPNHTDEPGEASCAICDHLFCSACIKPFRSLHLCKEHEPLIMRHDWVEVIKIKTSTQNPEEGVKLYDIKKKIFQHDDLATYIETHYKINVDQDTVETYLILFAMKEEHSKVEQKLSSFSLQE